MLVLPVVEEEVFMHIYDFVRGVVDVLFTRHERADEVAEELCLLKQVAVFVVRRVSAKLF